MQSSADTERSTWRERAAKAREQLEEWRALRALARLFGVEDADADDVAQEAAAALHRKTSTEPAGDGQEEPAAAKPTIERRVLVWGIARQASRTHRRRRARQRQGMEELTQLMLPPVEPTPEDRASARETAALLDRALEALRTAEPSLYEVLRGQLEGLAIPEIARTIGVPNGTVHNRLRLARKAIGAMVQRWGAKEESRAQWTRLTTGARTRGS